MSVRPGEAWDCTRLGAQKAPTEEAWIEMAGPGARNGVDPADCVTRR